MVVGVFFETFQHAFPGNADFIKNILKAALLCMEAAMIMTELSSFTAKPCVMKMLLFF